MMATIWMSRAFDIQSHIKRLIVCSVFITACASDNSCPNDYPVDLDVKENYAIFNVALNRLRNPILFLRRRDKSYFAQRINYAHKNGYTEDSLYYESLERQLDTLKACILVRNVLEIANPNTRNRFNEISSEGFNIDFPSANPEFQSLLKKLGSAKSVELIFDSLTDDSEFEIQSLYQRESTCMEINKFFFSPIVLNKSKTKACLYVEVKQGDHPVDLPPDFEGHYFFVEKINRIWSIVYDKKLVNGKLEHAMLREVKSDESPENIESDTTMAE